MKRIILTLTATAIFLTTFITGALAGDRGVHGLAIGGGTGAIAGHAIGRSPEAAIFGATVGGVIGLIVGSEIERHHRGERRHIRPVFPPPPPIHPPPHPRMYREKHQPRDLGGPVYRDHYTRDRVHHPRGHHVASGCRIDHHRPHKRHHRGHNRSRHYR